MVRSKKVKGAVDRNTSEFNQPITDKGNPILFRFGVKFRKDFESSIDKVEVIIK